MDHEASTSPAGPVSPATMLAASPVASPADHAAAVVRELETLEDVAIDQHVAAFELAHAKLRGLLTDDGHLNHESRAAS